MMSSHSQPKKTDEKSETLEGYVHLLSKVTSAKSSKANYFECHIQTDTDSAVRAVCYSPEKRVNLHQAFQNKSPVKITGVKAASNKRFFTGKDEYTIPKQARIMPSSLQFPYNETFTNKLCTVKDALAKDVFEIVDLKVTVIKKQENKQVIVKNDKPVCKTDCLVADDTGSIKLVLWEEIIDNIHAGKSYHFKNLKVRTFDDAKFLNTNESTSYEETDDMKDVNLLSLPSMQENLVKGQCIAVQLKRTSSCILCNMALDETNKDDQLVTCKNCNNSTLPGICKIKMVAQLMFKTQDQKTLKFTCFNDALQSLLNILDCKTSLNDVNLDELKMLILKAGPQQFVADKATQVISQFLS